MGSAHSAAASPTPIPPRYNFHYLNAPASILSAPKQDITKVPLTPNNKYSADNKPKQAPTAAENTDLLGFVLENFLTPEECQNLIGQVEQFGFESLDKEYPKDYRSNKRVLVNSIPLAQFLWHRIFYNNNKTQAAVKKQHQQEAEAEASTQGSSSASAITPPADVNNIATSKIRNQYTTPPTIHKEFENVKPFGIGNDGIWVPISVNQVIKFAKYDKGGKFLPHFDNMFVANENEKSIFTIIVYLNDNFEGGSTTFYKRPVDNKLPFLYSNSSSLSESIKKALGEHVCQVKAKTGTCVVFKHDVLHSGDEVTNINNTINATGGSCKYIIRAEIMFKRITKSASPIASKLFLMNHSNASMASILYSKADEFEIKGEITLATAKYLEALSLQALQNSGKTKSKKQRISMFSNLPFELCLYILQYCSDSEKAIVAIGSTNKHWNYIAFEDSVWEQVYQYKFFNAKFKAMAKNLSLQDNAQHWFNNELTTNNNCNHTVVYNNITFWYNIYKDRYLADLVMQNALADLKSKKQSNDNEYVKQKTISVLMGCTTIRVGFDGSVMPFTEIEPYACGVGTVHGLDLEKFFYGLESLKTIVKKRGSGSLSDYQVFNRDMPRDLNLEDAAYYICKRQGYSMASNGGFVLPTFEDSKFSYTRDKLELAVMGSKIQTGVLVHVGTNITSIALVKNGLIMDTVMNRLGGAHVLDYIGMTAYMVTTEQIDFKQKHVTVAPSANFLASLVKNLADKRHAKDIVYKCHSRDITTSQVECMQCAESFFCNKQCKTIFENNALSPPTIPSVYKLNYKKIKSIYKPRSGSDPRRFTNVSLQDAVVQLVTRNDANSPSNSNYYANIVLSGGGTLLNGFAERLQTEVETLAKVKATVVANPQRHLFTWRGLSKFAHDDNEAIRLHKEE